MKAGSSLSGLGKLNPAGSPRQSENTSAMYSVYLILLDWRIPIVRIYFADTGFEPYGLVEEKTESVITNLLA